MMIAIFGLMVMVMVVVMVMVMVMVMVIRDNVEFVQGQHGREV